MVEATNKVIDSAVEAVSWLNWTHVTIFCIIVAVAFAVLAVIFKDSERFIFVTAAMAFTCIAAMIALVSYDERHDGAEDAAAYRKAYVQLSEQDTWTLWEMEDPDWQI